jgi:hypothetical protein
MQTQDRAPSWEEEPSLRLFLVLLAGAPSMKHYWWITYREHKIISIHKGTKYKSDKMHAQTT